MPLHFTGLTSRYALLHPDEQPLAKLPPFELVLKTNPYHDKSGLFTSKDKSGVGGEKKPGAKTQLDLDRPIDLIEDDLDDAEGELQSADEGLRDEQEKYRELDRELQQVEKDIKANDGLDEEAIRRDDGLRKDRESIRKDMAKQNKAVEEARSHWHEKVEDHRKLEAELTKRTKPVAPAKVAAPAKSKAKVPQHSPEVKVQAKKLKLPGGKGVETYGEDYRWKQRGGYADSTMTRVVEAAEKAGFTEKETKATGNPDGSYMGTARTYAHPEGWELTVDSSYGPVKSDNWHTISLKKK